MELLPVCHVDVEIAKSENRGQIVLLDLLFVSYSDN